MEPKARGKWEEKKAAKKAAMRTDREKFPSRINIGDIVQLNPEVVKSILIGMHESEKTSGKGTNRNLILYLGIDTPKGQPYRETMFTMEIPFKDKSMLIVNEELKKFRSVGKSIKEFSDPAKTEIYSDIARYEEKSGNKRMSPTVSRTMIVFDTSLWNENFQFHIETIIRFKNEKRQKRADSQTMVTIPSKWQNQIMSTVDMNQMNNTLLKELQCVIYDKYTNIVLVIPAIFLIQKDQLDKLGP